MLRAAAAILGDTTRHILRGPWLWLAVAAFFVLAVTLPVAREAGAEESRRSHILAHGTAASAVLLAAALALPVANLRQRRHLGVPGSLPVRGVIAMVLVAQCLLLVMLAALMGLVSTLLLHAGPGIAEAGAKSALHEGSALALASADGVSATGSVPLPGAGREAQRFEIILEPVVRVRDESASAAALHVPVVVTVRDKDRKLLCTQQHVVRPGRGAAVVLSVAPARGPLTLSVRPDCSGLVLEFGRDSVRVRGSPAVLLAATLRVFLWLGLLATLPLSLTFWFTGFTSPPIATAATLTLLATLAVAGVHVDDPLAWVAHGLSPGWPELARALVPALLALACVCALPFKDRRLGEGVA